MIKDKKISNIKVEIKEGMPAEKALRIFKRLCDAYGIVKEYRARQEYKKPSIRAKEKRENAEKRRKKTDRKGFTENRKL